MPAIQPHEVHIKLAQIADNTDSDLAEGALWIAALESPDIDIPYFLRWIDGVAESAADRARTRQAEGPDAGVLSDLLFQQLGFRGNETDYYDVRNSCLNHVIERRRGIPITLSVLYLAVASRLGEDAAGISAPGHFLVRHREAIIDPFRRAQFTVAELRTRLESAGAPESEWQATALLSHPPDRRAILTRMLVNLRSIHIRHRNYASAIVVLDLLTHLDPSNPGWYRDRGVIYQHLGCHREACADLERYLKEAPGAPDAAAIRVGLERLGKTPRVVH